MSGQEVVTRDRDRALELAKTVSGDDFRRQVARALPEGVHPDRFVRVMATALLDNPDLAVKGDHNSIFQAGLHAARDGLLPDGREAAFVLFKDKCQYMPMIGGLRKIAAEYGWAIRTAVVYENDGFDYELGLEPTIFHKPTVTGVRGQLVAAYAVGVHKDGRRMLEVLTRGDVEKARAVSRASEKGPWVEWEDRMWEKTAGRRLFAKLPLSDEERASRVSRAAELAERLGSASDVLYARQIPAATPSPGTAAGDDGIREAGEPAEPGPPAAVVVEPDDPIVAEASRQKFGGRSQHAGKTLAQVAAEGDAGVAYVRWVAEDWPAPESGQKLKAAAQTFHAWLETQP